MSGFGRKRRSRRSRRSRKVSRKRSRKVSRRRSKRRSRRSRRSRRRSSKGVERVGNKVKVAGRGGKMKILKVKKDKEGNEFYVSGKSKKKHFLSAKRSNRRRRFGSGKDNLLSFMGNFQPPAQMSLAQSTTGFSAPQMMRHLANINPSDRANFYM